MSVSLDHDHTNEGDTTMSQQGPAATGGPVVPIPPALQEVLDRVPSDVPSPECIYRRGLLLSFEDLSSFGLTRLGAAGISGLVGYESLGLRTIGLLTNGPLHLYTLPSGVDPFVAAVGLQTLGHQAAPVLRAGYAGHWGYAPGRPPEDNVAVAPDVQFSDVGAADDGPLIGVIDTGFTYLGDNSLAGRISAATPNDVERPNEFEPDLAGHGSFVASVILQQRPTANVIIAAVRNAPLDQFVGAEDSDLVGLSAAHANHILDHFPRSWYVPSPNGMPDEIQMLDAVERLIDLNPGEPYAALNVSMGTYPANILATSALAVIAAVDEWNGESGSPIAAAAGNHPPTKVGPTTGFIPAELPGVIGVVAGNADGEVAPYTNRLTKRFTPRQDEEVLAVGSDIVGMRQPGVLTRWSGSSFATAVVSASIANEMDRPTIYELRDENMVSPKAR